MTESNTSGSTRDVIDAFVSAQENKQVAQDGAAQSGVVQNGVVQNGAVSQEAAPQVEPKQNVVAPNGVTQPVVADKKPVQKRKNIWKVLIPVIAVAAVGAVVAIVVINLPPSAPEMSDEEKEMLEHMKVSLDASAFAYSVEKKMENDADYTLEDAEQDFENLIMSSTGEEKLQVVMVYAFFVFEQTGDIGRASGIMKSVENDVADDSLAKYYISFGSLYRQAHMNEEANRYFDLALEIESKEGGL